MKEDNTPTITSRRRKPTPHQRLRAEKAKELEKLGALRKKKHDESKKQKPGETDPEKMVAIAPRIPKLKKNTVSKPAKPPAKFRKRQIHKSWLPTHVYHAKRAHMTSPKEPLWRFAIPLTPTEKCYRPTHRSATSRGCVAWDMSYMATIGIQGVNSSLLGLLRSIGVHERELVGKKGAKWRRGTRWWEGWIRERDGQKSWLAKVGIIWCVDTSAKEDAGLNDMTHKESHTSLSNNEHDNANEPMIQSVSTKVPERQLKNPKRRLLMRLHPSAFLQTWNEILKIAKIQRPQATIEDLRFEIGSIELIGPESTQALIGVLHHVENPVQAEKGLKTLSTDDEWIEIDTPAQVWSQLAEVTNPASLPEGAILGFNIVDPRLRHPPKTVNPPYGIDSEMLSEIMSSWPPDKSCVPHEIFDRTKRMTACRRLQSQKAVNRRKGEELPGVYPAPSSGDPSIPLLLLASRTRTTNGQGSWTLILPWECVLPVWYSLMHYPLLSGGNPRFGGLQEHRQVAFEQGTPWYPADFPGTQPGYEWELMEREKTKQEWERRPKGKRTSWESVDLGQGKKGEIGLGWACDWERLFQGPPPSSMHDASKMTSDQGPKAKAGLSNEEDPSLPSLATSQIITPTTVESPSSPTALASIHLTLLKSGHPTRNARIYRLPSTDPQLRAKWLALAYEPQSSKRACRPQVKQPRSGNAAPHERAQALAASLLATTATNTNGEATIPRACDPSYPCVPEVVDLIGFVTTGNYNLGEGSNTAIGNVAVARVVGEECKKGNVKERDLCIVREAGQSIGRLAKWKFI